MLFAKEKQKNVKEWPKFNQIWPLCFFGLILFLFLLILYGQIFMGKDFYFRDTLHNYRAMYAFVKQSLGQGHFPFWNPYLYTGVPQFAVGEPPLLYPPGWLLFTALPYSLSLALTLVLHQMWAGLGVFCLGKWYRWDTLACWLAGISWALSGVLSSMNSLHPLLMTAAWIPWLFLALEQMGNGRARSGVRIFVLCYSCQLLSGHLEIVYFETLLFLLYFLICFLNNKLISLKTSLCFLSAGIASVAIAMLQLLPSLYYSGLSIRKDGMGLDAAQYWSVAPLLSLMMILPDLKGNFYANASLNILGGEPAFDYALLFPSLYLGVASFFFLSFTVLLVKKNRKIVAWFSILCFAFLLSLGKYFPLYALFYLYLPGMSFFRYPIKFLIFVSLAIAILSGWGLDAFLKGDFSPKKKLFLMGYPLIWLSIYLFILFRKDVLTQYLFAQTEALNEYSSTYQDWAEVTSSALSQQFGQAAILIVLLSALLAAYFFYGQRRCLIQCLMMSVVAFDLTSSAINIVWVAESGVFEKPSELVLALKQAHLDQNSQFRYRLLPQAGPIPEQFRPELKNTGFFYSTLYMYNTLQSNFGSEWGFRNTEGVWPGVTFKNSVIQDAFNQSYQHQRYDILQELDKILATKYLIAPHPKPYLRDFYQKSAAYEQYAYFPLSDTFVFELKDAVPRARFTRQAIQTESDQNMLDALSKSKQLGFDFAKQVTLLKDDALQESLRRVAPEEDLRFREVAPVLIEQGPNRIRVELETPYSGYLVLSDQNLPGWKAFEADKEIPLLLANYMHRAVRLSPGKHQVIFEYEAPGFKIGFWISVFGLLIFALALRFLPRSLVPKPTQTKDFAQPELVFDIDR